MNCNYCGASLANPQGACAQCGRPAAPMPGQQPQAYGPQPGPGPYGPQGYPPPGYQQQPGYPPQQGYPPPQGYPPQGYPQSPAQPQGTQWKWGYSRWYGVHYGPIPVGVIVAVIFFAWYYSNR